VDSIGGIGRYKLQRAIKKGEWSMEFNQPDFNKEMSQEELLEIAYKYQSEMKNAIKNLQENSGEITGLRQEIVRIRHLEPVIKMHEANDSKFSMLLSIIGDLRIDKANLTKMNFDKAQLIDKLNKRLNERK